VGSHYVACVTMGLGNRFVFTTDPSGVLRVWVLKWQPNESLAEGRGLKRHAVLVAVCKSPLQARIVCLDGCSVQQVAKTQSQPVFDMFSHKISKLLQMFSFTFYARIQAN
jgi:hypothetical protein